MKWPAKWNLTRQAFLEWPHFSLIAPFDWTRPRETLLSHLNLHDYRANWVIRFLQYHLYCIGFMLTWFQRNFLVQSNQLLLHIYQWQQETFLQTLVLIKLIISYYKWLFDQTSLTITRYYFSVLNWNRINYRNHLAKRVMVFLAIEWFCSELITTTPVKSNSAIVIRLFVKLRGNPKWRQSMRRDE